MYLRLQPILFVSNLEAEKNFYKQLGFTITYEGTKFVAVAHGDILFGLQHKPDVDLTNLPFIWQIGSSDVEIIYRMCSMANIPIIQKPTLEDWGEWSLIVESPNGYRVIFEGHYADI